VNTLTLVLGGSEIMEYKQTANGLRLPVLGVGTWGLGGKHIADYSNDADSIKSISAAIGLGLTHIDTAAYYGQGHTEELVGKAIKPYEREDLFITTKVYRTELSHDKFISSVKKSLSRMEIDYVDLCLIHWPSPEVPLYETIKALETCVDEGLTRFIGVSNFSTSLLKEAQSYLSKCHLVVDQVLFNLTRVHKTYFNGLSVSDLHTYCKDNDILLVAWSPLEEGKLAKPGYPVLDELAKRYHKTPAQVSLNWLISQDNVVAVQKSSSLEHLQENLGALGWTLKRSDSKRLTESFASIETI
jgi:diketogulonate reductase-like aldo/keto reductase